MTKRQRFILCAGILSVLLLAIQLVPLDYKYVGIFAFFLLTYMVSAWALLDDLKGIEWITILTLPSMFSVAVGLFYFLLPTSVVSRMIILTMFGIGLYALYLTENIFSVAAIRTIQLVRAAHAIGFLLSVLTLVFFYNTIFSFKWTPWYNGAAVFGMSLPIMLQGLWSVNLEPRLSKIVWGMSLGVSLLLGEAAVALSFIPATVWIGALFLGTFAYVALGLLQHALQERLFLRTVYEYLSVGMFVFVATLVVIQWK